MTTRVFLFIPFCFTASLLYAQSQATTGSIEGSVSDASGRQIPGANVTLLNTGTNFVRECPRHIARE
jgi:hypothetical protein